MDANEHSEGCREVSEGPTLSAEVTSSDEGDQYIGARTCLQFPATDINESSDLNSSAATQMGAWPESDNNSAADPLEWHEDIDTAFHNCAPIVGKVGSFLQALKVRHNVSGAAITIIYNFFIQDNNDDIRQAVVNGEFPSIWTMRRKAVKAIPPTVIDYKYRNKDGINMTAADHQKVPRQLFVDRQNLLRLCARNRLEDLFKLHCRLHNIAGDISLRGHAIEVSSDGVKESNVAKQRFHIVSVNFEGCRQPMPW